jgi:hypothetical protein
MKADAFAHETNVGQAWMKEAVRSVACSRNFNRPRQRFAPLVGY